MTPVGAVPESQPSSLADHTLSEQYFWGYTTSRSLESDLDAVEIRPFGDRRGEYLFYRNHNVRGWVDGGTKVLEVPSCLLAEQVYKVHDALWDDSLDVSVDSRLRAEGTDRYDRTRSLMGDDVRAFYETLQPEGTVVLCRPEEFLSDLLSRVLGHDEDYNERFVNSSSKYLRRIDDESLTWSDAYESADGPHPKFADIHEMVDVIRSQVGLSVTMAERLSGVLRGYKLSIAGQTFTLLCRGWGRDMAHVMVSELVRNYPVSRVLFTGGCGALQSGTELNELVVPTSVTAPGEPRLGVENCYLDDADFRAEAGFAPVDLFNVDSPVDETVEYMTRLAREEYAAVEMEVYGIAKALEDTDVPFGALLFVMDLPMEGLDLGKTNYDPEMKAKLVLGGNSLTTQWTFELCDLLPASAVGE